MANPRIVKLFRLSARLVGWSVACALLAAAPASAAPADRGAATATVVEHIHAGFVYPAKADGEFRTFNLSATRRTALQTGEVTFTGWAGMGRCTSVPAFSCTDRVKRYEVTTFEIDTASGTAEVELRRGKTVHRLTLTGEGPVVSIVPVGSYPNECGGTTAFAHGVERAARGEGTMFGREVSTDTEDPASMIPENFGSRVEIEECP